MLIIFLKAIGLVLVIEGILPFVSPTSWRRLMLRLIAKEDRSVRFMGLLSLLFGTLIIVLVHVGLL